MSQGVDIKEIKGTLQEAVLLKNAARKERKEFLQTMLLFKAMAYNFQDEQSQQDVEKTLQEYQELMFPGTEQQKEESLEDAAKRVEKFSEMDLGETLQEIEDLIDDDPSKLKL